MYSYKTVPFPSTVSSAPRQMAQAVADELERLINQEAQDGWDYWRSDVLAVYW